MIQKYILKEASKGLIERNELIDRTKKRFQKISEKKIEKHIDLLLREGLLYRQSSGVLKKNRGS